MQNFQLIDSGLDVAPVLAQLAAHPELWNQHTVRKTTPGSPHADMDDIWVRFRAIEDLTSSEKYAEPHTAVFYPAWGALPALHPILTRIVDRVAATELGGILITRIPPGKGIAPHHDRGGWHAEHYTTKVYVPLKANEGCINRCEDESHVMRAGECWTFDNLKVHSVENNGDEERITLIVSMRCDA